MAKGGPSAPATPADGDTAASPLSPLPEAERGPSPLSALAQGKVGEKAAISSRLARVHPRFAALLAVAAGALQVCAYAPVDLPVFAVLAPLFLLLLLRGVPPARGAWLGLLYGLGLFGAGIYWIYYSLHLFGDAIAPLAGLLTAGFVLGMALYPAAVGYLLCRYKAPLPWWSLALAPALWTLAEWVRGWFLTGFPWLLLGHSQTDWPLAGYFPLLGAFGVTWLLALTAGAGAWLLDARPGRMQTLGVLGLGALVWIGGFVLQRLPWSEPVGAPIRVRTVQGNVEQHLKFIAQVLQPSIELYSRLSVAGPPVDLVIWPETAIPTLYHRVEHQLLAVAQELQASGAELAIGVLEYRHQAQRYYNAVRKVTPGPQADQVYLKHHLVPFGEYMPLRELLEFIARYILIPMSDLQAGPARQRPLMLAGYRAAVSICYEDAFGEEVIAQLPAANFLINVSNDAWFGDSMAPHQHLQIARVRALETARAMVRATNTGISAFIDHDGRILARSPQFEVHALDASIQPRAGATPYVRYGNYPVIVVLLLALCAAAAAIAVGNRK